ncbi:sialin-like [Haliotis cracherodii]|uniref:sialin-like n=1 Tax=Haliotis cracherodii TaxID=6455 RepID=UPI0039EACDE4
MEIEPGRRVEGDGHGEIEEDNEKSSWLQQEKEELPPPDDTLVSKFTSCRWAIAYMSAMASVLLITLRHCLSMAVVCMEVDVGDITNSTINTTTSTGFPNVTAGYGYIILSQNISGGNLTDRPTTPSSMYKTNPYFSRDLEGVLFSSYYYGYLTTPFVGGFLAARFGPKKMIGLSLITCSLITLLLPMAFRVNFYLAVSLRVTLGFASGVVLPSQQVLWSHWAPIKEKAQLAAFTNSGVNIGSIIVTVVSAMICGVPLDEGWPFIFYVYGGCGCVWLVLWMVVVFDSPESHPRMTDREKRIIYYMKTTKTTSVKAPWIKIVRSPPFWALVTLHFSEAWVLTSMTTFIPLYMDDVLKFSIKENGSLSSLPFIGRFIGAILSAYVADNLLIKGYLSTTVTRKLFQTIGSVVPAAMLIGVGFLNSDQRMLAVALLTLTMTSHSTTMASFRVNYFDIAPRYSGQIMGVTLSVAIIGTIINPLITSSMTLDKSQEQWQKVFFITVGIVLASDVIFLVFGSGQEQDWAKEKPREPEDPKHEAA